MIIFYLWVGTMLLVSGVCTLLVAIGRFADSQMAAAFGLTCSGITTCVFAIIYCARKLAS